MLEYLQKFRILNGKSVYAPPFIYPVIYLYQYELMDVYFILWVISQCHFNLLPFYLKHHEVHAWMSLKCPDTPNPRHTKLPAGGPLEGN